MNKINKLVILLLLVFAVTSCDNDGAPVTSESVFDAELNTVERALSDGSGAFEVKLANSDLLLALQFTSTAESRTEPATGTYIISRDKYKEYSVTVGKNVSYWTDKNNNEEYIITSGKMTVLTENGKSLLTGTVFDGEGNSLTFEAKDIVFTELSADLLELTQILSATYTVRHDQGVYRVILANDDRTIAVTLDLHNTLLEDPNNLHLPEGRYYGANSGVVGGLFLNASSWLDAKNNVNHRLSSAYCFVENEVGTTKIEGLLTNTEGESVRISFSERLRFNESRVDQDIFTTLTAQWTMDAENWLVYDASVPGWVVRDEHARTNKTMHWIGIPDYNMFFASGLWYQQSSGMYIRVNASGQFTIPIGYQSNPVMLLSTGSGAVALFPTMYDPVTGLFLSGGSISLSLSEDKSTFTVNETVIEYEGENHHLTYFGVVGYNLNTGRYTFFSDWAFTELPTFTRDEINVTTRSATPARALPSNEELSDAFYNSMNNSVLEVRKADPDSVEKAVSVKAYSINK